MKNTYCVIMAGGIGSRFWPMSRTPHPKQFIDILGTGKTLLQQTAHRFRNICPSENILVVTNEIYKDLVLEQLPEINEKQVLCEPARRNTAPCICYANHKIAAINPNANIVVAPSDHLVLMEDAFEQTLKTALQQAANRDCLVTLGIKPSRPDTGYGYIQFNTNKNGISEQVKKVKTFTEKPEHDMAVKFIESGDFYWNSGIFIWNLNSISSAFENFLPEVNELFQQGAEKYNTPQEADFINETYKLCANVSIDYGIMEKAENVFVVLSDFGWSDLGTWGSLYTHLEKDKQGNTATGKNVFLYDSNNCIVNVPKEKLVVLQGLDDYIVAESDNILLVCRKQDEQKIKQFVTDIKAEKGDRYA
jgi:mannose-1-phosphate guanylyltransferase